MVICHSSFGFAVELTDSATESRQLMVSILYNSLVKKTIAVNFPEKIIHRRVAEIAEVILY
jgi:hypothetical protein